MPSTAMGKLKSRWTSGAQVDPMLPMLLKTSKYRKIYQLKELNALTTLGIAFILFIIVVYQFVTELYFSREIGKYKN